MIKFTPLYLFLLSSRCLFWAISETGARCHNRLYAYTRPVQGWIFIPDISGFTRFVHETAISHSGHIIQELLEILVQSKELTMDLVEIEGDALFFLGRGPKPSIIQIEQQASKMFLAFHEHLLLYEQRRVCPCGACRTAHQLSLKFVVHAGIIEFIHVSDHKKPHGTAVITAHRLLKNDVASSEYLLLSNSISSDFPDHYESYTSSYDVGDLVYYVKELQFLKEKQSIPQIRSSHHLRSPDLTIRRTYPGSIQSLADLVIDLSQKELWSEGIDALEYNADQINQVGMQHICIIDGKRLNIETITREHEENEIVFGERSTDFPFIDQLTTFWIITPLSDHHNQLELEVFLEQKAFWKKLLKPLILMKFKNGLSQSFDKIGALIGRSNEPSRNTA